MIDAKTPLTALGWGPLKIGMRESDAAQHLGLQIASDDGVNSVGCREDSYPNKPELSVMAEDGIITRISVDEGSLLRTDRGFGVGSKEADIRKAYGKAIRVDPNTYEDEPSHYLTFWAVPEKLGVRYKPARLARSSGSTSENPSSTLRAVSEHPHGCSSG